MGMNTIIYSQYIPFDDSASFVSSFITSLPVAVSSFDNSVSFVSKLEIIYKLYIRSICMSKLKSVGISSSPSSPIYCTRRFIGKGLILVTGNFLENSPILKLLTLVSNYTDMPI